MKKLIKYKNGDEYIIGGIVGIMPSEGIIVEEYDLSNLDDIEYKQLVKNKKDKKLRARIKKIK